MICPHTLHPRLFRPSAMKTPYNTSRVLYVTIHFISERAGVFKIPNTTPPTHVLVGHFPWKNIKCTAAEANFQRSVSLEYCNI
jgi:hypothetical protein